MHKRLKEHSNKGFLSRDKCIGIISRVYCLKRNYTIIFLKELENFELIAKENNTIRVLNSDIDVENTSEIYQKVGMF